MFFFKQKEVPKPPLNSDEYNVLLGKIVRLQSEVLDIATAQELLRDKVVKKMSFKKPIKADEEENPNQWAGIPVE